MPEYTYKDVIIDPDDPRVEIWQEYWYAANPNVALERANEGNTGNLAVLEGISKRSPYDPFSIGVGKYPCIIRKTESETKYVPFDLSKEEDRARLRGSWIRFKDDPAYECQVSAIDNERVHIWSDCDFLSPEELLRSCTFLNGIPCGRPVEE